MPDGRLGEVISVVARRRRWTLEQKLALVEEVSRPGSSVAAVADRHGMSRSLLFEWRRQVREGTMPGVVRAEAAPALVPVRIVKDAPPKEAPCPPPAARGSGERSSKSAATVEVVLSNGRVLRVCEAIAPEVLGRLAAQVQTVLKADPFSGHLFLFRGRRGDLLKALWWDGQGLVLLAKRLEKGRFIWPTIAREGAVTLTTAQLAMLLEGLDWRTPMPSWKPEIAV